MLTIELHSHTYRSGDCLMRPEKIIAICRRRGIDRLCVTDHNTIEGALEMKALAPDLVIVGEEVFTTRGELLAYFVTEFVPPGLTPRETIERLRRQGAAISVPHPFDHARKGAWQEADLLAILPWVDAVETFNARAILRDSNQRAGELARRQGKLGPVGSDAHSYRELGRAVLRLPDFRDAAGLAAALPHAVATTRLSSPLIHLTSRWASLVKRLSPFALC